MQQIFRNFWVTVTRFKLASSLNILGLAVAFTVFTVIVMQSYWEFTFNDSIPDRQRIYYLESDLMVKDEVSSNHSRPFIDQVADNNPAIESYVLMQRGSQNSFKSVGDNPVSHSAECGLVSPGFVDVFGLSSLSGDLSRFSDPSAILITESDAVRIFGTVDAADRQLSSDRGVLFVAAVVPDFPSNSIIKNGIYINMGDDNIDDKGDWNYESIFKLKTDESLPAFREGFDKVGQVYFGNSGDSPFAVGSDPATRYTLTPLTDTYFHTNGSDGNLALSSIFIAIALLIIVIVMINFINFFMALVPMRIQSVNIHKIFGTPLAAIRANIVFEAVGTVLVAFVLSMGMLQLLQNSPLTHYLSCSILIVDNAVPVGVAALVALFVGVMAGLYPAYYITKFPPMLVIRGSFGRSKAGMHMRSMLVGVQYVISISLIIGAIFVALQTSFLQSADMGYDRDRLLMVRVHPDIASKPESFLSLLRKNPDIVDVAYSASSAVDVQMGWGRRINGEHAYLASNPTSWNYPELMGIKLIEGRYFIPEDASKSAGTMIVNQTAARKYGIKVGDFIEGHNYDNKAEVVGIVSDFHFKSLKYAVEPIVLYEFGSEGWYIPSMANIRIAPTADYRAVTSYIVDAIKQLAPMTTDDQIVIEPFDVLVESLYQRESRLSSLITLFSVIAILISLVGVFGLVVFEIQYRGKEITLRKILGATSASVLLLINRKFAVITLVSAAIAIPVAYVGVNYWLQEFAAKVALSWWVAPIAVVLVWGMTVAVVVIQTLRVATENPAKSLRSS